METLSLLISCSLTPTASENIDRIQPTAEHFFPAGTWVWYSLTALCWTPLTPPGKDIASFPLERPMVYLFCICLWPLFSWLSSLMMEAHAPRRVCWTEVSWDAAQQHHVPAHLLCFSDTIIIFSVLHGPGQEMPPIRPRGPSRVLGIWVECDLLKAKFSPTTPHSETPGPFGECDLDP